MRAEEKRGIGLLSMIESFSAIESKRSSIRRGNVASKVSENAEYLESLKK